jgi:UDP-N-acetylglucosamine diphosphorylase/glucosamine-1-phosphate N-acetyltransferase
MLLSLFDDDQIEHLYPLTLTRPAADLRCGILTIAEKWKLLLNPSVSFFETRNYLHPKFPACESPVQLRINGRLLPSPELLKEIQQLQPGERLIAQGELIAENPGSPWLDKEYNAPIHWVKRPYDIFSELGREIESDFQLLTAGRQSAACSPTVKISGAYPVFFEEGARAEHCFINAQGGPVYIGKNAEIMEGCLIRGPFAMGEGSVLKLGTKVYGPTSLGPYCVAGGEINNISMQAFSNKGHDGFLGNAVLGEWCNIGADSNCSNLKNNYEEVKVWNYANGRFDKSGLQFCGLIMGDHSKCGINTMFNTGTVVGVSANIFGAGFPRQFVPDFAWGGASGFITYKLDAACKTAALVMPRRKMEFTHADKEILEAVFERTKEWRNWD